MTILQLDNEQLRNLMKSSVREVLKENPFQTLEPTNQPEQWFDLNDLIKYDPEKRTKPTWYSKISRNEVPHYKRCKKVYFLKSEIDIWLKAGKCKSNAEIDAAAESYLSNIK